VSGNLVPTLLNGGRGYEELECRAFLADQHIITGSVNEKQGEPEYLYRGIAGRPFERRFNLADYVEVKGASFEDGLLQIELERRVLKR
jgi:molecular chaperone IbpA